MIREANYDLFQNEIKSQPKAFIKFTAEWCGHCKNMAPTIEELSNEFTDIPFYSVDCDNEMKLCRELKVMSLPTFIILKNGVEAKKFIGEQSKDTLENALKE